MAEIDNESLTDYVIENVRRSSRKKDNGDRCSFFMGLSNMNYYITCIGQDIPVFWFRLIVLVVFLRVLKLLVGQF